ncbi:MAG: nucleoside phosphorylase [Terracidiphilus sp.]|jgi:adenosylhomocysteine nucleosidase
MTRIAIIAAMPGELKPLVRGWKHERRNGVHLWRWRFDEGEWVAACAGAGVDAATRAFAETERDGTVDLAISTGWAGALTEERKVGQVYSVSEVVDARTGERFSVSGPPGPGSQATESLLVTSPKVADEAEKKRLAVAYGAGLVDMEAAAIARLAAMRGFPFYCAKGVSDGYGEQLPDFNRFISSDGQLQLGCLVLFCILRPWHWPALIRMGENSKEAAQAIRGSLLGILDGSGAIRKRNGYPNLKR